MLNTHKIKLLIADDHDIYRDGLHLLLSQEQDIMLMGEAATGRTLIALAKAFNPDVILTDLKMPDIDGVEAIKEITALKLGARCIALSTFDSDRLIIDALEAGAMGYIVKNAKKGEITEAIQTVYENHPYYCKSTSMKLARRISGSKFNPYKKATLGLFTETEIEIIRLICEEKTSDEIGKLLFIGKRTVEGFRSRILEKAGLKSSIGLVIYAIKNSFYFLGE